ncbi:polysaccharide biosynthesis/export family protein [Leisingera caerulea]|uniref:polysaccharide biosynthesis/export family protein n=1 Tax=Leisingera caerulea TaxID=506591 RepID=UPI0021A31D5E|nr:polysaccharide biosynthesis/export family protein [Leisingera caerulea]UWQ83329.1 polysaccharide biosynthesis/export family protein [Leisingera caerulea]
MRRISVALSAMALAGLVSGCSTVYRSPAVKAGVSEAGKVRVVALTPETVLVANRAAYQPKTLPAVFQISAGSGAGASPRGAGTLPNPPSTQDGSRQGLRLDPPPQADPGPYTIGTGDVVVLSTPSTQGTVAELSGLLAAQNSRNGYTVQDDGSINIPDVGRVRIAGLTVDEAEALLFQRLVESQIDPTFSLEVSEFNSRRVSIGGAVGKPGVLPITLTPLTLGEALAAAGSVSVADIDVSSVRIYRDGRMYQIPLEDLYSRSELQRLNLLAGDSVFVDTDYDLSRAERFFAQQIQLQQTTLAGRRAAIDELTAALTLRRADLDERRENFAQALKLDAVERDYVYLSGEVRTQGRYTLPFGHKATLADALFDTGGGIAKETGDASEVYVLRASDDIREFGAVTAWHLDVRNAAHLPLAAKFELRPGDIVFVAENPVTRWGRTIDQITPSLITAPVNALSD